MQTDRLEKVLHYTGMAMLAIWILACIWFPLTDTDIWWHLASAKWMWAHLDFLHADPFCQVSLGVPWTDLHWGFQLMAYGVWKMGGAFALITGKGLAILSALTLIGWPNWNRHSNYLLLPLLALGIYLARFYLDVRPLVVTLFVLAAQYAILQMHFQDRFQRPWLLVVPLQIVMVNVQGLYPLGAFLVTCIIFEKGFHKPRLNGKAWYGSRSLLVTIALVWLASVASPYGWRGMLLPFHLFGRIIPFSTNIFSVGIAENAPFWNLLKSHPTQAWGWIAYVVMVLATFNFSLLKKRIGHLLIFLVFTALALMAVRNLPLVFLAGFMAASGNLKEARFSFASYGGLVLLILLLGFLEPNLKEAWAYELHGKLETPFRYPSLAVDYLSDHPIAGNIFNDLRYGGYLDFRMFPGKRAFVDGRMILRSEEFYRNFLEVVDHPAGFSRYCLGYGITHALLPISEDGRFLPLASYLLSTEGWKLLHCDGASALLAKPGAADEFALSLDSLPPEHPIQIELRRRFGVNSRLEALAWRNTSDFLAAAGCERAASDARNASLP